jgi:hypothetical protein
LTELLEGEVMKLLSALLLVFLVSFLWAADFWVEKDYTSWTQKECETVLTKSPWVFSTALFQSDNFGSMNAGEGARERTVIFRFRLLSAKPIRMAFGQLQMLEKPGDAGVADQMKQMVETAPDKDNRVAVQIDFSVKPPGDPAVRDIHSFLLRAHLSDFRDNTYLSASKKENISLLEYRAPGPNQPNAVFIFPRVDESGAPVFDGSEKWISLRTEILNYKIYARSSVEKMKFHGTFEF